MNRVEFARAVEVAGARMAASMDNAAMAKQTWENVVSVFAGIDLPAHDVMRWLDTQVVGSLAEFPEIDREHLAQGVSLNAFLLGFECGRRSK